MTDATLQMPPTLDDLRARRDEILAIAERHKAYNVRVFGSVARGDAKPGSDVDFLVTYRQGASLFDLAGLFVELQDLLGVPVDVVDDAAIKERFQKTILAYAVPL
jgi:predicted nucleotidyltransferase